MGRKTVLTLIAIVGYLIGTGIYALVRLAIPQVLEAIRNLNPWLIQNPWFTESMLSGVAGAFVALVIVHFWSKTVPEY
ncbi:MAG: hypothetical protein ACE5GD_04145 [Candidatus Geothermarchaeales archaeon]